MPRAIDGFAVDLMRCALLRSDAEIRLRPKAFDVLCHLAPNWPLSQFWTILGPQVRTRGGRRTARSLRHMNSTARERNHGNLAARPKLLSVSAPGSESARRDIGIRGSFRPRP
jgi:hypothetical protein